MRDLLSRAEERGVVLDLPFLKTTAFGLHLPTVYPVSPSHFGVTRQAVDAKHVSRMGIELDKAFALPRATQAAIVDGVEELATLDAICLDSRQRIPYSGLTDIDIGQLDPGKLADLIVWHSSEIVSGCLGILANRVADLGRDTALDDPNKTVQDLQAYVARYKDSLLTGISATFVPGAPDDDIPYVLGKLKSSTDQMEPGAALLLHDACVDELHRAVDETIGPLEDQLTSIYDQLTTDGVNPKEVLRNGAEIVLSSEGMLSHNRHNGGRILEGISAIAEMIVATSVRQHTVEQVSTAVSTYATALARTRNSANIHKGLDGDRNL